MDGIQTYSLRNNPVSEELMGVMEDKQESEANKSEETSETLPANVNQENKLLMMKQRR